MNERSHRAKSLDQMLQAVLQNVLKDAAHEASASKCNRDHFFQYGGYEPRVLAA